VPNCHVTGGVSFLISRSTGVSVATAISKHLGLRFSVSVQGYGLGLGLVAWKRRSSIGAVLVSG